MTTEKISDVIRDRIKKSGKKYNCNSNISEFIHEGEMIKLQQEVQDSFQKVLESLVIDTTDDHNSIDTAKRVAKMYCQEIFSGRFKQPPKITSFPNVSYDQLYVVGPIMMKSTCGHHFMPFLGEVYIGIFPGSDVIGLSKFHRICEHISRRPSIQEELTEQLAEEVQAATKAKGVAILVSAKHLCVSCRGVEDENSEMVTSKLIGSLRDEPDLRNEFFRIVAMKANKRS